MNIGNKISAQSFQEYSCRLLVNGIPLAAGFEIISIQVKQAFQWIGSATILLKVDVSFGESLFQNPLEVSPLSGKEIEIIAVHTGEEISLFKGLVVKHKYTSSVLGTRLHLTAKHKAIALSMNKRTEVYADKMDKDILDEISQSFGLTNILHSAETSLSIKHNRLVKSGLSDWDFINSRAEANLCFVYTEPDQLVIEKPMLSADVLKQVNVNYGVNVYSIELEQDDRMNLVDHQYIYFDPADQKAFVHAEESTLGSLMNLKLNGEQQEIFSSSFNELESKQALDAAIQLKNISKINGVAHIHASLKIKPGFTLIVDGYESQFNQQYLVTSVLHDFSEGVFSTYLQFGMHHQSFESKYQLVKQDKHSKGLINAIVVALENDPDNLSRILVSVPLWNQTAENIWARYMSPYAGNEYGMIWLPEIGDEVLLGFIGDNYDMPIVMGGMYSPANPPFETFKDDNFKKGLQTKKGMKWSWDDEKGIHEISTPNGNKILMSEEDNLISIEDANQNIVLLNDKGIELKSAMDVHVEAGSNLSLKAGSELNVEGVNINIESSGILTLKGSLVKIN